MVTNVLFAWRPALGCVEIYALCTGEFEKLRTRAGAILVPVQSRNWRLFRERYQSIQSTTTMTSRSKKPRNRGGHSPLLLAMTGEPFSTTLVRQGDRAKCAVFYRACSTKATRLIGIYITKNYQSVKSFSARNNTTKHSDLDFVIKKGGTNEYYCSSRSSHINGLYILNNIHLSRPPCISK